MAPLQYHHGQIQVQDEANTRHVASKLAHWVGPVAEYAVEADLLLLALGDHAALRLTVLSGPPPLAEVVGRGRLRLHPALAAALPLAAPTPVGGLVISLERARRARVNGRLSPVHHGLELEALELFTLCRKYMTPTRADPTEVVAGPSARAPIALDDDWATALVASARTSFLASLSPTGMPDVAHRGGPPGFLTLDPAAGTLTWPEFVGDGVFKSAGNVRATPTATLLIPDLASGDALELQGDAVYETIRTERRPRTDPLVRFRDPYPLQGRMTLRLRAAERLRGLAWPRRPLASALVTSCSSVDEQAPEM